ncbi:MAG: DUF4236 domain-containing protein [Chloroflexota bacterium]
MLKGVRYQKRIRLGKFLALNISKSGVGLSVGVRGLRYTVGPTGSFMTVGLPGSGIRYQRKVSDRKGFRFASLAGLLPGGDRDSKPSKDINAPGIRAANVNNLPEPDGPEIEKPGFFAPRWEKALYEAMEAYHEGDEDDAIDHLRDATDHEDTDPGAMILLAFLLSDRDTAETRQEAIELLEEVITTDKEFPSPILKQYMSDVTIEVDITPQVDVNVPLEDGLAPTLQLVELYQLEGEIAAAIALLEEMNAIIAAENGGLRSQLISLSQAELYLATQQYQIVIDQIEVPQTPENDILLGLMFYYGRALQEQKLHTAAVDVFTKALRRKKGLNPDLLHACRLWRAMSYLKINKKPQGREELERVLAESGSAQLKKSAMQALKVFWPQDF